MAEGTSGQRPKGFQRGAVERIGHNASVQFASQIAFILIGLLLAPLILQKLGLELFGVWTFVTATIGYLTLVDPGLNQAVVRFGSPRYAAGDVKTPARYVGAGVGVWLAVGVIVSPALLWAVPFIEQHLKGASASLSQIGWLTVYAYCSIVFAAMSSVLNSLFTAAGDQWLLNLIDLASRLLYFGLAIWLLEAGHGLAGLAIAMGIQSVLGTVAMVVAIAVRIGPPIASPFKLSRAELRELAHFGGWAQATNLFRTIGEMSNTLFTGLFVSASGVGVLNLGSRLARQIPYLATIPQDTLVHTISARFGDGQDREGLRKVAVDANRIMALFSSVPGFALVGLAPVLLVAWLGHPYRNAAAVAMVMALNQVIRGLSFGARSALISTGHVKRISTAAAISAAVNVGVTLALVFPFGLMGIVLGTTVAVAVNTAYLQLGMQRDLGATLRRDLLSWAWRQCLPGALAASACILVTLALPSGVLLHRLPAISALVLLVPLYLVAVAFGLRLCGGFEAKDFATLHRGLPGPVAKAFNSTPVRWVAKAPADQASA